VGLCIGNSETPIIPIHIGSEEKAFRFAMDLFDHGVFALPAVYPAVPKGRAIIRTAYMSTHEQHHIDFVLEVLDKLAGKHHIRTADLDFQKTVPEGIVCPDSGPAQAL
jgi:glycine C-acetyltransferase